MFHELALVYNGEFIEPENITGSLLYDYDTKNTKYVFGEQFIYLLKSGMIDTLGWDSRTDTIVTEYKDSFYQLSKNSKIEIITFDKMEDYITCDVCFRDDYIKLITTSNVPVMYVSIVSIQKMPVLGEFITGYVSSIDFDLDANYFNLAKFGITLTKSEFGYTFLVSTKALKNLLSDYNINLLFDCSLLKYNNKNIEMAKQATRKKLLLRKKVGEESIDEIINLLEQINQKTLKVLNHNIQNQIPDSHLNTNIKGKANLLESIEEDAKRNKNQTMDLF